MTTKKKQGALRAAPPAADEYAEAERLREEMGLPDTDGCYSMALDEVRRRRARKPSEQKP